MGNRLFKKIFWGVLIILIGVLYLLFNVGALPIAWKPVLLSWQAFLVLIGVISVAHRHYFWGAAFAALGIVLLLPQLSVLLGFTYSAEMCHAIIWPAIIILLGLGIIAHSFFPHHHHCHCHHHHGKWEDWEKIHKNYNQTTKGIDGTVDYNCVFNGIDDIFLGPEFRGGSIDNVFGGVKLDLRRTSLAEGNVILKINSVFGGVSLFVPEDWPIELQIQSVLGEFKDKRNGNGAYVDRKLIIIVSSVFSGGEIKC